MEAPINADDSSAIVKLKNFYSSCTNQNQIEVRGEEPLLKLLDSVFGGWDLIGRHNDVYASMDWVSRVVSQSSP